jgi:drug/metabolite transporter (DMT)-like permease
LTTIRTSFKYLYAILAMSIWGLSFVWTAVVFKYYHPITTVFIRLVISSIIMFAGLKIAGRMVKIRREDYRLFALSALFNPFLYFLGESFGIKYTSSTISAVVIAIIPLVAPVAAWYVFGERLRVINIVGIFISFTGILVMLLRKDLSLAASPTGIGALLLAVAFAVLYDVQLKKLSAKYPPFTIIAVQNIIGACYFLPFFLVFDFRHFITVTPNAELVTSILALAVFASSLAFVLFTISTRELGISRTNIFSNLIPLFAAVFSYFILSESFTFTKIAGMMIVVVGVLMGELHQVPGMKKKVQRT